MPYKNKDKQREYQRNWKRARPLVSSNAGKAAMRERNQALVAKAKDVPCKDCGIKYPYYVMDFDHLPEHIKFAKVSELATSYGQKKLLEEISKCEVVCANCHRERTYNRKHQL